MSKFITVYIDGKPSYNLTVEKTTTIKQLKNSIKNFEDYDATFYSNKDIEVKVLNTNKYDKLTLESVWSSMKDSKIELLTLPNLSSLTLKEIPIAIKKQKSSVKTDVKKSPKHATKKESKSKTTDKEDKKDKESLRAGFTGDRDFDKIILIRMPDKDLAEKCKSNSYAKKLCSDDILWMNRLQGRFDFIDKKVLKKIKETHYKTWREYYVNLVDFLEKLKNDKNYGIDREDFNLIRNN